jgi:hypothetical protein
MLIRRPSALCPSFQIDSLRIRVAGHCKRVTPLVVLAAAMKPKTYPPMPPFGADSWAMLFAFSFVCRPAPLRHTGITHARSN